MNHQKEEVAMTKTCGNCIHRRVCKHSATPDITQYYDGRTGPKYYDDLYRFPRVPREKWSEFTQKLAELNGEYCQNYEEVIQ